MKAPLLYRYPPLQPGLLIRRYQRFFVDIELSSGEVITAHCPNTGPMRGIYQPGSLVQVSRSDNPKRKLAYTWEMIQLEGVWIGTNTGLPNRVMKLALEGQILPELAGRYTRVRSEVPLGTDKRSRVDFFLSSEDKPPIYLEVKSTTWNRGETALFPDTVTTRGQKHLEGLMKVLPEAKAVMVYFINRGDCTHFAPGDSADPRYDELLRAAMATGVEVLPYRFEISPQGLHFLGLALTERL